MQAPVRESRLFRRGGRGDPPSARARLGRADPGRGDPGRQDGDDGRDQRAARTARRAHAAGDDARLPRRARDRLSGAAENFRPQHSSSPSSSIPAWSRSTSACSRTVRSRRRPIPNACAPRSPKAKAEGYRRRRDRVHARLALSGARARRRRDRARARICPGLGKPCRFRPHQARRARRHDGGRRLSLADPGPLRRPGVARSRRRAHRRAGHVHDVVGRPHLGQALRRQGRDPVRACRRRGGDGADRRERRLQARHRLRHGRHFDRRRPFRRRVRARLRDRSRGRAGCARR